MTSQTAVITALALALCAPLSQARRVDDGPSRRALKPGAFHLSSFDSELAGRFSMDEGIDTGAVALQWINGLTGDMLRAQRADLGAGPSLNVRWTSDLDGQKLLGYCLAGTLASGADRRLIVSHQIEVRNTTAEEQRVQLVARLLPGGKEADRRPFPSLAHDVGEAWARQDDRAIVRNGQVVASWVGHAPDVELVSHPESGEQTAARLVWNFTVMPGESHWLEVLLAGPPAGESVDELAWRARFLRKSYGSLEDLRRWESMYHGQFGAFTCADERVREAMISGIHVLRSLGNAHYQIGSLSDRPFGHPASDAGAEAQILGTFFEYGLNEISEAYLDTLLDGVYERAGPLPLERKVAYLHGLARALRLSGDTSRHGALAAAILELLRGEGPEGWAVPWNDGAVAVAPWLDPDQVRGDLRQILTRAGLEGADELPRLAWAENLEPGSAAADMLATRKALSAGDADRAWLSLEKLLDRTTRVGVGSMQPGGPTDGRFAMGIAALVRGFLIDDHGTELQILPGICNRMMKLGEDVQTAWMPTAFGQLQAQAFFTGKSMLGGWVTLRGGVTAERTVLHFPVESVLRKVKMQHGEGTIEILEPNTVQLGLLPGRALRFNLTIRRGKTDEQGG